MHRKNLTYNISGSRVCLKPVEHGSDKYEIRVEGLIDDTLILPYASKKVMLSDIAAFNHLFERLSSLKPEAWGNTKGVMSRGEIRLMRLALLIGCIPVLACLVWLLVQLFR